MKDKDSKILEEAITKINVQNDKDINNFFDMVITDYLESGMIDENSPTLEHSCWNGAKKIIELIKNTTGADFSKYIRR